jgi:hypothetical protein
MRLATKTTRWFMGIILAGCFVPAALSQQAPASKPKTRTTTKPKAAAAAKPKAGGATAAAKPTQAKPADASAAPGGEQAATSETAGKRDPFSPLVNTKKDANAGVHLPPGKAGLVIATVRVDGTVRSGAGMIAVVSNPGSSVYFIREGDRLYDGDVEKIGLDGVTFKEESRDAFGNAVERTVTKRIYAIAGEQQ